MGKGDKENDDLSDEEVQRRLDSALKRSVTMPPKSHDPRAIQRKKKTKANDEREH